MSEQPTEPHYPFWGEEEDPPTEEIPAPALKELPLPPPVTPPPFIMPAPPVVRHTPVEAVDSGDSRGRAGTAVLCFAMLIAGGLLGFFFSSLTAAKEIGNTPPEVQIQTQTATKTATAYKTKTRTETARPAPVEVTRSPPRATVTQKVIVPKPGRTKTVTRSNTPQSCLNALDAADQYLSVNGHGRGNNEVARQARANFRYWSHQCQKASG